MQAITWTLLISPDEWRELRRELARNEFSIPYEKGMAENRKTGYRVMSRYDAPVAGFKVGRLTLTVSDPYEAPAELVVEFLTRLFTVNQQGIAV